MIPTAQPSPSWLRRGQYGAISQSEMPDGSARSLALPSEFDGTRVSHALLEKPKVLEQELHGLRLVPQMHSHHPATAFPFFPSCRSGLSGNRSE